MIKKYKKINMEVKINKHKIKISHPDKILFTKIDLDKKGIIKYYRSVAKWMLPWLKDYPLTLHRYPDGINQEGFYQKQAEDYFPSWIKTIDVPLKTKKKTNKQVLCNNEAILIYLANLATIEFHRWLSKKNHLNHPKLLIFDLDPPNKKAIKMIPKVAKIVKTYLDDLNITSFPMLTGSRGLHIIIPLKGKDTFKKVRNFAKKIVSDLVKENEDCLVGKPNPKSKSKKIFLDYLRNAYGQTGIAPYSLRARKSGSVATPVRWKEVFKKDFDSQAYTYKTIQRRLNKIKDPWSNFWKHAISIKTIEKKIK